MARYKRNQTGKPKGNEPRKPARLEEARDLSRAKMVMVMSLMALLWLALWFRAADVQLFQGPELAEKAWRQHRTSEVIRAERGRIFDREGRLLATSVEFTSVYANPLAVTEPERTARVLADILRMPVERILKKLSTSESYVWISRHVGDPVAVRIEEADLPGVGLTTEYGRQYPNRELAGRILGFVGVDETGLEGLEASYDEHLSGRPARYVVQRDASGHVLYLDAETLEASVRGKDISLTLDAQVQFVAEEALNKVVDEYDATWAGALVVEVKTGEVLAWAESPGFNPNAYGKFEPRQWRNRIAMDAFEPGSVAKPLVVAAALQEGVVDRDTLFFCENGKWNYSSETIRDVGSYAWLPVHKIVRYSSNIGMAKLALEVGSDVIYRYFRALGFGEKVGLPFMGEARGILRQPSEWDGMDIATAGFGQGFAVSMAQLARAYLCLANEGVLKPLKLVRDPYFPPAPEYRVFDAQVARQVMEMLREVVEEDGSGTRARIDGVSVSGKTSTAQKAEPEGGYGDEHVAAFVGFVPALEPEYMVLVMVDEPQGQHYGGIVAAPVFKEIMVKTLAYLGEAPGATLAETDRQDTGTSEVRMSLQQRPVNATVVNTVDSGVSVPDVRGLNVRIALEIFLDHGLVPSLEGEGLSVVRQEPKPGQAWPVDGGGVTLWLSEQAENS